MQNIDLPSFYILNFSKYDKNMKICKSQIGPYLGSGLTPKVRPDLRFSDQPNMPNMFRNAKYLKYVFISQSRVRWAGRRSSAAIDMFARGAVVTVTTVTFHSLGIQCQWPVSLFASSHKLLKKSVCITVFDFGRQTQKWELFNE